MDCQCLSEMDERCAVLPSVPCQIISCLHHTKVWAVVARTQLNCLNVKGILWIQMADFRASQVSAIFGISFSENQYVGKQMSTFKDLQPEFPSRSLLIVLPWPREHGSWSNARYAPKWHLFPGWGVPTPGSPKWQCNVDGTIWWYQHTQFLLKTPFKSVQGRTGLPKTWNYNRGPLSSTLATEK